MAVIEAYSKSVTSSQDSYALEEPASMMRCERRADGCWLNLHKRDYYAVAMPNLTDVTFMTKEGAKLFVNSPNALDENRAEKLDTAAADYVAENTANVDAVYDTEAELLGAVRTMVGLLPSNNEDDGDCAVCEDDVFLLYHSGFSCAIKLDYIYLTRM